MDLGGFIRRESVAINHKFRRPSERKDLKLTEIGRLDTVETTILEKNGSVPNLDWDESSDSFREDHDVRSQSNHSEYRLHSNEVEEIYQDAIGDVQNEQNQLNETINA